MAPSRHRRTALWGLLIATIASPSLSLAADAALATCKDLRIPSLSSRAAVEPPQLLSPGVPGYPSAFSSDGHLEFYIQSHPGAGPAERNAYTRDVKVVLSSPSMDKWEDAALVAAEGCKFHTDRFMLNAIPSDVTVLSEVSLLAKPADKDADACFFNHRFRVALGDLESLKYCNFNRSTEVVEAGAGKKTTFEVVSGRIHVRWTDYDSMDSRAPVRAPMSTYYPISMKIQTGDSVASAASATSAAVVTTSSSVVVEKATTSSPAAPAATTSSASVVVAASSPAVSAPTTTVTPDPTTSTAAPTPTATAPSSPDQIYNKDFKVKSFLYSKSADGIVTARIAYNISLNYPFYPFFKSEATKIFDDGTQLLRDSAGRQGGLELFKFPSAAWKNEYLSGVDGKQCDQNGDKCMMEGVVSFSWKPSPGACSLASTTPQQFDFLVGCFPSVSFAMKDLCSQPLRVVAKDGQLGAFAIGGAQDLCASGATNYSKAWPSNFAIQQTTAEVGKSIAISGNFTSPVTIKAIWMKDYRVSRSDLKGGKGYWSLWNEVGDNYFFPDGSRTELGNKVNMQRDFKDISDGKIWQLNTFFTPNVKVTDGHTTSSYDDVERKVAMVTMPSDKGKNLTFSVKMMIRLYYDPAELLAGAAKSAGAARRMQYRQVSLGAPQPVEDMTLETAAFAVAMNDSAIPDAGSSEPNPLSTVFTPQLISIVVVFGTLLVVALGTIVVHGCRRKPKNKIGTADEALRCERDAWHTEAMTSRETRTRV